MTTHIIASIGLALAAVSALAAAHAHIKLKQLYWAVAVLAKDKVKQGLKDIESMLEGLQDDSSGNSK